MLPYSTTLRRFLAYLNVSLRVFVSTTFFWLLASGFWLPSSTTLRRFLAYLNVTLRVFASTSPFWLLASGFLPNMSPDDLAYLFSLTNEYRSIRYDLRNMAALASALGNPQKAFR